MKEKYRKPQISDKGLVAHYKLWAGLTSPGKVFDYSLNGNIGTVANATPAYPGFAFNGVDRKITIGDLATIKTFMFWLNPNSESQIVLQVNDDPDYVELDGDQLDAKGVGFDGMVTWYVNGIVGTTVTIGAWNCIVGTHAGQDFGLSILGNVTGVGFYDGKIGETMLFSTLKAISEIQSMFNLTRWRYGV